MKKFLAALSFLDDQMLVAFFPAQYFQRHLFSTPLSPGYLDLPYVPAQTGPNANSNITISKHIQVWDARSPHP